MTDTRTAQHTPGPWKVVYDNGYAMLPTMSIIGHGKVRVAVVHGQHDARLIEAAPDLLGAVKAALPAFVWAAVHTGGNAVQFTEVESMLRAAIAKVEGEEQR